MKTKLLLLLTAVLLSSCSVFRKSEKHKLDIKSSVEMEQITSENEQSQVVENSQRNKTTVEDSESNTSTTIEADEITFKPDGTIEAKGNVKAGQKRNDSNKKKGEESENSSKITDTNKQTDSNMKVKEDVKIENKDIIPEEPRNPIWHWIGGGLFAAIVLVIWLKFR